MHDLVRAFAAERALAEDRAEVRQAAVERACGTFLLLADRAHQRYYGGHFTLLRGKAADGLASEAAADTLIGAEPLTWLDDERSTLMATVRQAAAHGLDELCWNIAMTAITLFETHGYFDEWRSVSEIALASCRAAGNLRGEGAMVYALSSLAIFQQRYADARPLLLDAIEIFTEIGEVHGKALALRNLALSERVRGDVDSAVERYEQALQLLRVVGDRAAEAHVLVNTAAIHLERDQPHDAEPLLELALAIFRQEGVPRGEAQALSRLADLALRQGSPDRALEAFEAAARIVRTVRDRIGEAYVLHGIGEARLSLGQVEQAERALLGSLEMARGLGERHIEGRALLSLGLLLNGRGSPEGALQLEQAHELFAEMEAELWRARAAEALARTR